MNRNLIVAAISVLAAGTALAQSSVTIYGRLNLSAEQQKNVNAVGTQSVLQNSASRIGFKGTEDLGGGLKAGFQLEHGFNPDTGSASQSTFWARQSEVNLSGSFGMIRLGNFTSEAYYATADYISMHNHDTGTSEDKLYAYVGRNTNKIAYRTPELVKGLTLEGAVSAGEGVAGRVKSYDLAANWNLGALQLGAGYEKNDKAKQFAVRALYEMGPVVLGAYFQDDTNGYGANFGSRKTYRVSAAYNVGASEFHVNYGMADDYSRVVASTDATQFTLGYNYNLSKRTKVYAFYSTVDNSRGLSYFGASNASGALDPKIMAAGIRHNF